MPSHYEGASFSVPDVRSILSDESSSFVSNASVDQTLPTPPMQQPPYQENVSNGQPRGATQNGQRPHEPQDRQQADTLMMGSPPPPSLSAYARSMLLHTKQQMEATSGSPPPPHIHVAGPVGNYQHHHHNDDLQNHRIDHSGDQHEQNLRQHHREHGHNASLPNGTMSTIPHVSSAARRD